MKTFMKNAAETIVDFHQHMKGRTYVFVSLIGVALLLSLFGISSIVSNADESRKALKERIALSYEAETPDMFQHHIDTDGGDTIVNGPVKSNDCLKKDDGSDADKCYASIRKIVEREETRVETYSCGTSEKPQTCTRTVTEWVKDSDTKQTTNTVNFNGQTIPYNMVEIQNDCGDWKKVRGGFFSQKKRYCYATTAQNYEGFVGLHLKEGKADHAFTKFVSTDSKGKFSKEAIGSNTGAVVFGWIFGILLVIGAIIGAGALILQDQADGKDNDF